MPRVSAEHRTARRRQILDAARRCFDRNGFHRTSMQHILTEAGLSAGAVYGYFRSKDEIMTTIAGETIGQVLAGVGASLDADPPPPVSELLDTVLTEVDRHLGPDGMLRLAVQVWGESMHDAAMSEFVAATYARLRALFVGYAERATTAGVLPAGTDPAQAGAALFGLIPGYILQRVLIGEPDRRDYLAGVRALLRDRR
ncbi:TetR family transcriptional regulator [Actinocatenispora thailandica]|uniref:TetR family transcriptional regulator n=1 Tax=Actinocatenispora thailandica TaxID=227318 RepID=A0A7R7DTT0_9ACTN|nr:TetR/AcrR family transcriptional regulator [Actinocatenispora thailandica]BCJ37692.1 TetR family transcriptional regulator [Actinocatenispora thailandica]